MLDNAKTRAGYYYSTDRNEIVQTEDGDTLPTADHWEYIGSTSDMTPADAVDEVQERYPDISVELEFNRH